MDGYSIADALAHRERQEQEQPERRRRRWRVAAVAVVVLALAAGGGWAYRKYAGNDVFESPGSVELPALPDDRTPTVDFLAGNEGALIVASLDATEPLEGEVDRPTCTSVAQALDAVGGPAQIFSAAAGVPDGPTSEMAVSHLAASTRFLGTCFDTGVPPSNDEVRFTATVLRRRLAELR